MNENKLRTNHFPYNIALTNGTNGTNNILRNNKNRRYNQNPIFYETPTTYMVVNFDQEFKDNEKHEYPDSILKVNKDKMKNTIDKFHNHKNNNEAMLKETKTIPKLASSYNMSNDSRFPITTKRNMFRRNDISTQTQQNLKKLHLDGLPAYQKWTSDIVEPFLKVRFLFY